MTMSLPGTRTARMNRSAERITRTIDPMRKPVLTYFRADPRTRLGARARYPDGIARWCVVIAAGLLALLPLCYPELALLLHPTHR